MKVETLLKKHSVQWCLLSMALVIVLVPIIGSFLREPIDCDSAYYLSMVERISEGYVPYKTLHLGYTPLWFYLMAAMKWLFKIPYGCYEFYLAVHYLFQIGCALCIYGILRQFKTSKAVSFFSSFIFVLSSHWLNGNVILLETPSLFWGLLSSWLVLFFSKRNSLHYLWIGVICAFSFLSKQFGAGFFLLNLLLLFMTRMNHKYGAIIYYLFGYSIPIFFCFCIWKADFLPVIFSGYGTTTAEEAGYDVAMSAKLQQIISNLLHYSWRMCIAFPVSLIFVGLFTKQKKIVPYVFALCGVIGFSFQYYFVKGGLHYALYMIPFSSLIIGLLLSLRMGKIAKCVVLCAVAFTLMLNLYSTFYNRVYKHYIVTNQKQEQIELARQIKEVIPDGSSMWIVHGGLYSLHYLTNIVPPNIGTIGYSFGPLGLNEEKAMRQAEAADYVLAFSKDYPYESFYTDRVKDYVSRYPYQAFSDGEVLLFKCEN